MAGILKNLYLSSLSIIIIFSMAGNIGVILHY
jgi:hypothetical protein